MYQQDRAAINVPRFYPTVYCWKSPVQFIKYISFWNYLCCPQVCSWLLFPLLATELWHRNCKVTLAPQTSKYCGSSTPNSTVGIDLTSDRNTSTSTSVSSPKTALQSHQRFLLNSNIVMFTVSTSLVDTLTHVQHSAAVHLIYRLAVHFTSTPHRQRLSL